MNAGQLGSTLVALGLLFGLQATSHGQVAGGQSATAETIEIRGDRKPSESEKLVSIWLFPEDHNGKRLTLKGFIFEPENFEYFPDLNGYLFSCEPVNLGRNNAFHAHVGDATFLSREKLNFFCSTADGQRIRQLFKQHQGEIAIPASVELVIRRRDGCYFADLITFTPHHESE